MTYEKPWMKLSVHFDADQTGSQLDYSFTSCDGTAHPYHGPNTGSVHFERGQHVYLDVTGCGSEKSGFTSFDIIDCCIISVPQITQIGTDIPTLYSPPSPFLQAVGAVLPLQLDFVTESLPPDPDWPDLRRIRQEWQHNLDVGQDKGRWEISFVVTVRILRGDGTEPELRVFSFDPEGSVGGDTIPQSYK